MARRIYEEAQALRPRQAVRDVLQGYAENNILTYASAISFQIFFALIPAALFMIGASGLLHLQGLWRTDIAPAIRPNLSQPAFTVIDRTVYDILTRKQLLWATVGAAIAVWEISGAVRAIMGVFNSIYAVDESRSFWRRILVSCTLAAAVGALCLAAAAVAQFGGRAVDLLLGHGPMAAVLGFIVRWGIAVGLLLMVVALLVRFAPATRRPVPWVTFGALLVVLGWVAMSLLFGWYVTAIADYTSVWGGLATLIVGLEYLYLSSIVFVTGAQLDSLIRRSVEGSGERLREHVHEAQGA